MNPLITQEIYQIQLIKGLRFPSCIHFRQLIIVGPPGSGKSHVVQQLGGWSEEGYIDISAKNWWRMTPMAFRPRQLHFGIPFVGIPEAMSVFDPQWLNLSHSPEVDCSRIQIPPQKKYILSVDWRSRYAFEFLLIQPELIYEKRQKRMLQGTHPVDQTLSLEQIQRQVAAYQSVALHMHRHGMQVYIRFDFGGAPNRIVDTQE